MSNVTQSTMHAADSVPGTPQSLPLTVQGVAQPLFGSSVGDWDAITIAGITLSQTRVVIDGTAETKLDVKPVPGSDGARETQLGYIPAHLTITVELYTDAMLAIWASLVGAFKPKPGKTLLSPTTIDHPYIRMFGWGRFLIPKIGLKQLKDQKYEGFLTAVEYFKQPKTSGKQPGTLTTKHPTDLEGNITTASTGAPGALGELLGGLGATPGLSTPSASNTGPT